MQREPRYPENRALGLKAVQAKKFEVTTNPNNAKSVVPDLVEQDFSAAALILKWTGDITYIWTDEGWLYLAVVMNLYSRAIVSWSINRRMMQQVVCDAMAMALFRHHSPRAQSFTLIVAVSFVQSETSD